MPHSKLESEKFNYLLTQQNEAQSLISQYVPSDHSFSQTTFFVQFALYEVISDKILTNYEATFFKS